MIRFTRRFCIVNHKNPPPFVFKPLLVILSHRYPPAIDQKPALTNHGCGDFSSWIRSSIITIGHQWSSSWVPSSPKNTHHESVDHGSSLKFEAVNHESFIVNHWSPLNRLNLMIHHCHQGFTCWVPPACFQNPRAGDQRGPWLHGGPLLKEVTAAVRTAGFKSAGSVGS